MTVWSYTNTTTGDEMECNDLKFLMHELMVVKGFTVPVNTDLELIVRGKTSCKVSTADGVRQDITIERRVGFKEYNSPLTKTVNMN